VRARWDEPAGRCWARFGPVWNGNEVWLLAGGEPSTSPSRRSTRRASAVLSAFDDRALAFDLPGISIEFRNHIQSLVWQPLWTWFSRAPAALLAFSLAPRSATWFGRATRPGPASFSCRCGPISPPARDAGILDWLHHPDCGCRPADATVHGSLWVALKTEGAVEIARAGLPKASVGPSGLGCSDHARQFPHSPHLKESFAARPWGSFFPALGYPGTDRHPGAGRPA